MKWGKYLNLVVNETPEWAPFYLNYKKLKSLVKDVARAAPARRLSPEPFRPYDDDDDDDDDFDIRPEDYPTSSPAPSDEPPPPPPAVDWSLLATAPDSDWLTTALPAALSASPASASFLTVLNAEVHKVSSFYDARAADIYAAVRKVSASTDFSNAEGLMGYVTRTLSRLREFSTVNYTGVLKILKKHDKFVPSHAHLRELYVSRVLNYQSFHTEIGNLFQAVNTKRKEMTEDDDDDEGSTGVGGGGKTGASRSLERRQMSRRNPRLSALRRANRGSSAGYHFRDLNNDVAAMGPVKKEVLCVARRQGRILVTRDHDSVKLIKAELEAGESTADAGVRVIREVFGIDVAVTSFIGEFMSTSRKGTVYDAYLLDCSDLPPEPGRQPERLPVWLPVDEAMGEIEDVSSLRALRKLFDTQVE